MRRWRAASDPLVLRGRFTAWGRSAQLDLQRPWLVPDLGDSWNYPLHYFEYAPPLAQVAHDASDSKLARAVQDLLVAWIEAHPVGQGVAWHPYPTALRLVCWLDVVHTLGDLGDAAWRDRVLGSCWEQAAWLAGHLERHLLGTHLLKDLKALLVASSVFSDATAASWRRMALPLLRRELTSQIRADGGHVEPSIMYHCLALEDLLDLLAFDAVPEPEARDEVQRAAAAMLRFAGTVATPAGDYPLLGDASLGATPSPRELLQYARALGLPAPPAPGPGMCLLPDSGLAVWRDARQYLLADVGPVGPKGLAGHGHCDSLSFEWHVGGLPFVVDSGTRSYEAGEARRQSRSTAAHNTLEIDAREQHEMWASFRVARRSRVQSRRVGERDVEAVLVPWYDARLRAVRRFEPNTGVVRIVDRVEGPGQHRVESWIHLHPECESRLEGSVAHLRKGEVRAWIVLPETPRFELLDASHSESAYCERFGEPRPNAVLRAHHDGPLPYECVLELRSVPLA